MSINLIHFKIEDSPALWESTVGIEREAARVDKEGQISRLPHPTAWGSREYQPYIQTDFAEGQIELITPPVKSVQKMNDWLKALHQIAQTTLNSGDYKELIWPFSLPPSYDDLDSIQVAQLTEKAEFDYRDYLVGKYGKAVQLTSGIHYNFEINPSLFDAYIEENFNSPQKITIKNNVYMSLARKFLYYQWLLTYLLGASPYAPDNYTSNLYGDLPDKPMRTVRQSRYGYRNDPSVKVSYQSLEDFVTDIEQAVDSGALSLEKELYRDVRMRGGQPIRKMIEQGIQYLEFRSFDLNPYEPLGISEKDMMFVKLWIIALTIHQQENISETELEVAIKRTTATAEAHPLDALLDKDLVGDFWDTLEKVAQHLDDHLSLNHSLQALAADKKEQLFKAETTLGGQVFLQCPQKADYKNFGLELANKHKVTYDDKPYLLHGFEEFELSTQNLMRHAIRAGLKLEIIDASDNFIRLSHLNQKEYIKSANMTRLDSQITHFIMENKLATKQLLTEAGISVPQGVSYTSLETALTFNQFNQAFVVKPKNTNFGLGITIFQAGATPEQYQAAIKEAFNHDDTVIVEKFIKGTELRFYVQDGKTLAVCERQPAQIKGDGQKSISELIDLENENPMRGPKHFAPLSYIEKGYMEKMQLERQGYHFDSIPAAEKLVLLRENSNVSSGGIAIDRTDEVHSDYKIIAEKSAEAMGAVFCGVDIIIEDYHQPVSSAAAYSVLETNFNPMMTLHIAPAIGKSRPLSQALLKRLFPIDNIMKALDQE